MCIRTRVHVCVSMFNKLIVVEAQRGQKSLCKIDTWCARLVIVVVTAAVAAAAAAVVVVAVVYHSWNACGASQCIYARIVIILMKYTLAT